MQAITKIITRSPRDKKQRLLMPFTSYPSLAWLALFVIAGLEIYYLNRYGDPDTVYLVGGICTLLYGPILITVYIKQRQSKSRLVAFSRQSGGMIEEGFVLDDEGIESYISGYFSQRLSWSALSKYRNRKRHIVMTVSGNHFLLPKRHFSDHELKGIDELLRLKSVDPNKRFFENDRTSSPPSFPQAP